MQWVRYPSPDPDPSPDPVEGIGGTVMVTVFVLEGPAIEDEAWGLVIRHAG